MYNRPMIRRLLAEPLTHFIIVAVVIVAAARGYELRRDRFRIVMTRQRVAQLAASYRQQFGVDAGPHLTETLVQSDFEDEVLYREALALGLDKDDELIRRRLIQKMKFLTQDQQAPPEPPPAVLQAYYDSHRDRYRTKPSATFTHVFFSADGGTESGRSRAVAELRQLQRTNVERAPSAGDLFPDRYDFAVHDPDQVARLFGRTEFLDAVFSAPIGQWAGPYRSAYGWHLLRVQDRRAPVDTPFDALQDKVRGDYLQAQQERANAVALDRMKNQFTLVREGRVGE